MNTDASIFVAGHSGLVGSAIVRRLRSEGFTNLLTRSHKDLDLRDQHAVRQFFAAERPQLVILAAARVGGILANTSFPADFVYDNLAIELNVVDAAYRHGSSKLVFLGSSCVYPKHAPQPLREDALLSGPLETTNQWYAIAKIAGLKLCQAYRRQHGFNAISLMPTNLYGPGDNFSLEGSHVLPALIRKVHDAKKQGAPTVEIWGTGTPRREFLHVDDLADACLYLLRNYDGEELVNVGWGEDISILELAEKIVGAVGFSGRVTLDTSKPDGTPRKVLDTSRLKGLGWSPQITLDRGIEATYRWYVDNEQRARA